jgi:hypothetical protein
MFTLVTAHRLGRLQRCQPIEPQAPQNAADGRWRDAQPGRDLLDRPRARSWSVGRWLAGPTKETSPQGICLALYRFLPDSSVRCVPVHRRHVVGHHLCRGWYCRLIPAIAVYSCSRGRPTSMAFGKAWFQRVPDCSPSSCAPVMAFILQRIAVRRGRKKTAPRPT